MARTRRSSPEPPRARPRLSGFGPPAELALLGRHNSVGRPWGINSLKGLECLSLPMPGCRIQSLSSTAKIWQVTVKGSNLCVPAYLSPFKITRAQTRAHARAHAWAHARAQARAQSSGPSPGPGTGGIPCTRTNETWPYRDIFDRNGIQGVCEILVRSPRPNTL